ncbi:MULTISPECIES: uracil-DNA glycosylase family protein [Bartonella]|uniref:uracil-DNA glycosylase n=1 Tax=Bartonella TaxID=773 RepID=UPI0018DCECC4|nr:MULTISPECIES: uracil-DNA glycosylase [Bartonella]MBH9994775.1 uracil-DNA glycosylase [Bartonella sp. P0291]MBH9996880.1 uracil-DNA glycosylase [Bartonella sp. M0192]MBH9999040.1 uracil-DNA glycosylase [Bartonella sp. M0191]MBI0007420.1 uracil-DNA glycosylase [Bartonella sp. M0193]MBI0010331.1 uracil-DNA glycosylase [Bartonella sp. M0176]
MSERSNGTISYEELLGFYSEAGVDTPLDDKPIDRFKQSAEIIKQVAAARETAVPQERANVRHTPRHAPPQRISVEGQVATANELARNAKNLDELFEALKSFNGCTLKLTAKNTCFADGTPHSKLMLVGEAPGREEDLQGIPFVGRSGMLLNRILAAIGLKREDVYIANTIPWRPPGNRTPTPMETELCRPFIERQIELSAPEILVALGGPAMQVLTGVKNGIIRTRGQWLSHHLENGKTIPVMPTFHPAYLLRTPSQKKLAWADFLEIRNALDQQV